MMPFLHRHFAASVEMYAVEVFRAVEKEGQSLILVFLCYSDSSGDLEGDCGTGKVS